MIIMIIILNYDNQSKGLKINDRDFFNKNCQIMNVGFPVGMHDWKSYLQRRSVHSLVIIKQKM